MWTRHSLLANIHLLMMWVFFSGVMFFLIGFKGEKNQKPGDSSTVVDSQGNDVGRAQAGDGLGWDKEWKFCVALGI